MFTTRNLSKKLSSTGMTLLLSASLIFSAAPAGFAQGPAGKRPAKSVPRLDIKRGELVAKTDDADLPVSPIEEDNTSGANTQLPGASTRSTNKPDIHGESSVENFMGTQKNLSNTHESANGFKAYLENWYPSNFHRKDAGVSSWLFQDNSSYNYDLWTSGGTDLGIDGVRTAFHSSHGGMSSNNYCTSLGSNWASTGWNACSNKMALGGNYYSYGDERLRYMFWDTCQSVKISGGNDPYTTWGTRSKGIRFVFGYETDSIDSPNYGKYFWEEWNKGKTFKYAFLDASWRISTGQAPSLVAFGLNSADAVARRDNERLLYAGSVSNNWAAWSWYNARSASFTTAAEALTTASRLGTPGNVDVVSRGNSNDEVSEIAEAFGIQLPDESAIKARPTEIKLVRTDAADLVVEKNGNFELTFKSEGEEKATGDVLADDALIARAQELAGQLSFINGQTLRVGMIRDLNENTGTEGIQGEAQVTEKTIVLDQTLNDTPFIDPEAGHLEITFGARSGQLKRVRNTLKAITISKVEGQTASAQTMSLDEARQSAMATFGQAVDGNAAMVSSAILAAESEAVGYQMIDGRAVLVYRALISSSAAPGMRPFQAIIPLVK